MGNTDRRHDRWVHWAAEIALRLGYAILGMGLVVFLAAGSSRGAATAGMSLLFMPGFWLVVGAVGVVSAVIGPWVYRHDAHRGRGSLTAIRRESRRDK